MVSIRGPGSGFSLGVSLVEQSKKIAVQWRSGTPRRRVRKIGKCLMGHESGLRERTGTYSHVAKGSCRRALVLR